MCICVSSILCVVNNVYIHVFSVYSICRKHTYRLYVYTCILDHVCVVRLVYIYVLSVCFVFRSICVIYSYVYVYHGLFMCSTTCTERWGAGVETQKNVRGEIGGWGRVPFNETYAPSLSTIHDGA